MPFAGIAVHRFGSRVTALIAGILLCAVLSVLLLTPSLPAFVGVLFLVGVFNGQFDVGMNSHSVAVQHRFERPILSAVHGWFSVGGFAGGASAALAAQIGMGDSVHLAIMSAVLAATILLVFGELLPATVDADAEGVRFALPVGPLAMLGVMALCSFLGEGAIWDWAAVYLRTVLQSGAALGALGFGLFSFGMAGGRFIGDRLVHTLGPRVVISSSAALAAGGLVVALTLRQPWAAIAGLGVGAGLANIVPILFRAAGSIPGIPAATGLAAVTTCGYTGFLFGPAAIGFVAQARSLGFALGGVAALCLLVAVLGPGAIGARRRQGEGV